METHVRLVGQVWGHVGRVRYTFMGSLGVASSVNDYLSGRKGLLIQMLVIMESFQFFCVVALAVE